MEKTPPSSPNTPTTSTPTASQTLPQSYNQVPKLVQEANQEWRRDPKNPKRLELIDMATGVVLGYRDALGKYYKAALDVDVRAYLAQEEMDLILQKASEGMSLVKIASETGFSLRQLRYWIKRNVVFQEKYEEALWSAGHHSWHKAEILAEELAEGVGHKPTADSKAKALDYYTTTRDKLLKDEFALKTKQEVQTDRHTTIVFQSKEEYTEEDRARLAKEVGGVE